MKTALRCWILVAMIVPVTVSASNHSNSLQAHLDRTEVYLDESVNLIVTFEGAANEVSGSPDLSMLENDFDIVSESTQTNIQIQNGVSNIVHNWIFGIRPKKTGTLAIAGITIGGHTTEPLEIEVREFTGNVQKAGEDMFVEIEATPRNPYVQSQMVFITRLFTAVDIARGSFSDPVMGFADVQRLGGDRRYESKRGGRDYAVIEKRYAVFPEQSGTYEIPPVEFTGVVSSYDQATLQTQYLRKRISSESVAVQVRPKPLSYTGKTWLPASDLQILDSWGGRLPDLEVGRPESREISIEAVGLRAIQLTSPDYESSQSLRIYSNSPALNTHQTLRATVAQRKEEFVFIPNDTENLTIPEFRVVWWDVDEDREKVAVLPKMTNVRAASAIAMPATGESDSQPSASASADTYLSPVAEADRIWMLVSLGMLVMWLLTIAGWFLSRRKNLALDSGDSAKGDRHHLTIRKSVSEVRAACRDDDANGVAVALLDLARLWWPDRSPRNLIDFGNRVGDTEFSRELQQLDLNIYSNDLHNWDGDQFWKQFARIRRTIQTPSKRKHVKFLFARSRQQSDDLWFDQELSTD
ncbi:MAG: BatD family protein [Acidiferrobacterales bacterium]|nr:BatD family protein [Acidiferrobacterales bacterium]